MKNIILPEQTPQLALELFILLIKRAQLMEERKDNSTLKILR